MKEISEIQEVSGGILLAQFVALVVGATMLIYVVERLGRICYQIF